MKKVSRKTKQQRALPRNTRRNKSERSLLYFLCSTGIKQLRLVLFSPHYTRKSKRSLLNKLLHSYPSIASGEHYTIFLADSAFRRSTLRNTSPHKSQGGHHCKSYFRSLRLFRQATLQSLRLKVFITDPRYEPPPHESQSGHCCMLLQIFLLAKRTLQSRMLEMPITDPGSDTPQHT